VHILIRPAPKSFLFRLLSPRSRFPPPWSVEELDACFVMRDHKEQTLAYVSFEDEPGRRSAAKLLSKDEGAKDRQQYNEVAGVAAQAIMRGGSGITRPVLLPELLGKS
jgi:hypothetical protein